MLGRQSEITFKVEHVCQECGNVIPRYHGYFIHNRLLCGKCADLETALCDACVGFKAAAQLRRAAE